MLATAFAAVIFGAIEFRELSAAIILFAPVLQSAVIGALAGAGFKVLIGRLRRLPVVALTAACGGLFGVVVGMAFVGHSPHFSHDKAVVVLASSWFIVASGAALLYVLSPNKS